MKNFTLIILCLFALTQTSFSECICEDGSKGMTKKEARQAEQDLKVQIHNMRVLNKRAEDELQAKLDAIRLEAVDEGDAVLFSGVLVDDTHYGKR